MKTIAFPLFVSGDRPERFIKAAMSGCDCVIVDLEDAVAPENKIRAREGMTSALSLLKKSLYSHTRAYQRGRIGMA